MNRGSIRVFITKTKVYVIYNKAIFLIKLTITKCVNTYLDNITIYP